VDGVDEADRDEVADSIKGMVEEVQSYVPGYRLKQKVQFESQTKGMKTSIFLEVEGAGHYLPTYAGNLDIMTSAALQTAERLMELGHVGNGNGRR